jgi:hypothetical protein
MVYPMSTQDLQSFGPRLPQVYWRPTDLWLGSTKIYKLGEMSTDRPGLCQSTPGT